MSNNIIESEHILTTPELIGTDEEKIGGIKFWADAIEIVRMINTVFVSYENKLAVIAALKKELDTVEAEIINAPAKVSQGTADIPSAEQTAEEPEVNLVDLTKNQEVAATTIASAPRRPPTFENLDKLRRVAGSGVWDKNYVKPKDKKK